MTDVKQYFDYWKFQEVLIKMTGYKRVNFYELCRLCTSSQQRDKIHIFREEGKKMQLQHKIQTCFPLLVSKLNVIKCYCY